jgi:Uma2 family endonuclease
MLTTTPTPPAKQKFSKAEQDLRTEERTGLTVAEAEALADGRPYELIDGRMVFKMADRKHSKSQGVLIAELHLYFKQNPIGQVLPEFSVYLWPEKEHEFRVPDIAVFLNENMHEEEKYETRAPDLAIEIASDDDKASALFAKARLYLEKGGRVVWIVFPFEKRAMVMTPTEWRWESDALTCPELLPGFSIKIADIFSSPLPKSTQPATPIANE